MTDASKLWVRGYLGSVYVAGAVALVCVIATAEWHVPGHVRDMILILVALLVVGEFLPIRLWSRGSFQEYTFSGAFALVLLQTGPLVYAVCAQIVALLIEDIRQRRSIRVAAFNVAQYTLMFVFARLAINLVEGVGVGTIAHVSAVRQMMGLALAAAVYFVINNALTATIFAMSDGAGVKDSIVTAMREEMPVTPIVLGLAPMFSASLEFSVWTAPLCMFLIVAVRAAAKISTEHEIAALHDPLTGLPNRTLLLTRLRQSLQGARPDRPSAVLMIDLDHFKEINDSLGHSAGDQLLELVASRLTDTIGPRDTVARLGGDEFAIVVDETTEDDAAALADRIAGSLGEPFSLAEVTLNVAASVGVAMAPRADVDADTVIRHADLALYSAKRERGRHVVYNPRFHQHMTETPALMGELRQGIERGELRVHFQPKVSVRSGQVVGMEALVRWQHPTRGLLSPGLFLSAVENTPLIVPLTDQVINESLRAVAHWRKDGMPIDVSINLTARQVANQDLPRQIEQALASHGLPGDALVVEMTESCLIANPVRTREVLNNLRAAGVGLSIDDFGTGYSSFTQLRDLPVTEIKIDKSFVTTVNGSTANAAIVKSAIDLGHNLGLHVVAEGVETYACLDVLTDMGCDVMQGYLLARPMPAADLTAWSAGRPIGRDARRNTTTPFPAGVSFPATAGTPLALPC
jgi:diguanylate cyclase (GGDEF)-like protein